METPPEKTVQNPPPKQEQVLVQLFAFPQKPSLKIALFSTLGLIFIGGVFVTGLYLGRNNSPVTTKEENQPTPAIIETAPPQISDNQVKYLSAPGKIESPGFMQMIVDAGLIEANEPKELPNVEPNSTYHKIGEIREGKYQGKELLLVETRQMPAVGPGGPMDVLSRFIIDGPNYIYLAKHSQSYLNAINKQLPANLTIDNEYEITSLKTDGQILFNYKGVNTIFDGGWYNLLQPEGEVTKIGEVQGRAFFRENRQVNSPVVFRDLGKTPSFYLRLPDSTYIVFQLSERYISSIPQQYRYDLTSEDWQEVPSEFQITWTDNLNPQVLPGMEANRIAYSKFISNELGNLLKLKYYNLPLDLSNDLVQIGSNQAGDKFYGLKDNNHLIYTDFYDKRNKDFAPVNNLSYQDFYSNRPMFFWQDIFGDYHALFRTDLEQSLGMAKPTLYPYQRRSTNRL